MRREEQEQGVRAGSREPSPAVSALRASIPDAGQTPLPWAQGTGGGGGATNFVYETASGAPSHAVASCYFDSRPYAERAANAAYIAHACNAHPVLLEALETAFAALSNANENGFYVGEGVFENLNAALAKARGSEQ